MSQPALKYLFDIEQAANRLQSFLVGVPRVRYLADPLLQAATERQFEIIGEAVSQLARLDATLAGRISDYRRLIAFRNILIHGYAEVDQEIVWDLAQTRLPELLRTVQALLQAPQPP